MAREQAANIDADGFVIFDPPVRVVRHELDPLPYFELYASRFLLDSTVRALSLAKRGIYLVLLCEQWSNRGLLPGSWNDVARLASNGLLSNCLELDGLQRFFGRSECGQYLLNRKLWMLYNEKEALRSRRADAGRRGGKAKPRNDDKATSKQLLSTAARLLPLEERRGEREKENTNTPLDLRRASLPAGTVAIAFDQESPPPLFDTAGQPPQAEPPPKKRAKGSPKRLRGSESDEPAAAALFAAYPRRVARGAALKAIAGALKIETAERLMAAVQKYAASVRGKDPAWVPYPATWFNQQRWLDEPEQASNGTPGRVRAGTVYGTRAIRIVSGNQDGLAAGLGSEHPAAS